MVKFWTKISSAVAIMAFGGIATFSAALADDLGPLNPFSRYASPQTGVLAVQTKFDTDSDKVRVIIYDNELAFLEEAAHRYDILLDDTGLAVLDLADLSPGEYAIVVYLDENEDGRLNRNLLGRPKEPFMFSNGVKPKFRKPLFSEAKVGIENGKVIVITLDK